MDVRVTLCLLVFCHIGHRCIGRVVVVVIVVSIVCGATITSTAIRAEVHCAQLLSFHVLVEARGQIVVASVRRGQSRHLVNISLVEIIATVTLVVRRGRVEKLVDSIREIDRVYLIRNVLVHVVAVVFIISVCLCVG